MFTAAILCRGLEGHVLRCLSGTVQKDSVGGIALLRPDDILQEDQLYLGDVDTVTAVLRRGEIPPGTLIASAGDSLALHELTIPPDISLVVTDLDLIGLYNLAHRQRHKYDDWLRHMDKILYQNSGLQALIDAAALGIPATIMVLNAGYKPLAAHYTEDMDDATTLELREKGYLTFESVHTLLQQHAVRGNIYSEYSEYVSTVSGKYTIIRLLTHEGNVVARICVLLDSSQPDPFITDMSAVLEKYVSKYMFNALAENAGMDSAFTDLVGELVESRLRSPDELAERLKRHNRLRHLNLSATGLFYTMLVVFPAQNTRGHRMPWNYLIGQLEQLFPQCSTALYREQLLMLIPVENEAAPLSFDVAELNKLLLYYDGYAALGNLADRLINLSFMYRQVQTTVRLGRVLCPEADQRLFRYEDYSVYELIEMSVHSLPEMYSSNSLSYLCHPAQIRLLQADRENSGDLCRVLHTYLNCECNSTEAAKQLGIHRNTMLYKIHRIEQIMGQPLEGAQFLDRLRFGFYVLLYVRDYLRVNILDPEESLSPAGDVSSGRPVD